MAKKISDEEKGDKPNMKWTTTDLKNYIRENTKKINQTIAEYDNALKLGAVEYYSSILEESVVELQLTATGKATGKMKVQMGLQGKTKRQLLEQAKEIQSFIQVDLYSPAYLKNREAEERKRMKSFNRNWGTNLNMTEWRQVARVLNSIMDILNEFGYEDLTVKGGIIQEIVDAIKSGKKSQNKLIKLIEKIKERKDKKNLVFATTKEAGLYFLNELVHDLNE